MSEENRRIAKNSLLLYIRLIATTVVGIFSTRIVIRSLGVEDYGLYSVIGGIVAIMTSLNTTMTSTTYRFITVELGKGNKHLINKVFNVSLVIHIMLALLLVVISETLGIWYINNYLNVVPQKINDAIFVFQFSVLAVAFNIISIPFQGLVTAVEKFSIAVGIEITRSILRLLFVISLIYFTGNKLQLYAVLMTILSFIPLVLYVGYCKKKYFYIIKWKFYSDIRKYKEMLFFSGWTMLGASASIIQNQGTEILINYFFGTILNASFGIASRLKNLIIMFSRNIGQAAIPQIMKQYAVGDMKRVQNLVTYVSKYSFFLMLLISLPVLLETKFLMHIWIGVIPPYTINFIRLMIILGLFDVLRSSIPSVIQATGKIKIFQIAISGTILLSLPIAFIFFYLGFPPYYILVVYIILSVLATIITIILLKKQVNFNIGFLLKKSYLPVFFVTISMFPLILILNIMDMGVTRFLVISFSSVSWASFIIFFIGLEKKERQGVISNIKLFKNKIMKNVK